MAQRHYNTDQTLSQRRSAGAEPHLGSVLSLPTPGGQSRGVPCLLCPLPAELDSHSGGCSLLPLILSILSQVASGPWAFPTPNSTESVRGIIWGGVPPRGRAGRGSSPPKVLHLLSAGLTAAGLELS